MVEVSLGCFALVMTLGRALSPKEMSPEEEQDFLKNVLDYIGAYFAEGEPN